MTWTCLSERTVPFAHQLAITDPAGTRVLVFCGNLKGERAHLVFQAVVGSPPEQEPVVPAAGPPMETIDPSVDPEPASAEEAPGRAARGAGARRGGGIATPHPGAIAG